MTSTLQLPTPTRAESAPEAAATLLSQIGDALRHPEHHKQAFRFLCVGGSGYVVNTITLAICVHLIGFDYGVSFGVAFLAGTGNNFWWNRTWTFDAKHHHIGKQGVRFLIVSAVVAAAAFGISELLLTTGMEKVLASALAYVIVTPLSFLIQKLWSFKA